MANINDLFPSRFLKTSDLQGKEPNVKIARVELETVGHAKREQKLVVYFAGKTKGLKLNKTLATTIARIAGSPLTEQWVGVGLCLYSTSATFGKDAFPVVGVKAATTTAPAPGPRLVAPPASAQKALQSPPAAAGARTHPRGYLAWVDVLRAAAAAGTPALEKAWRSAAAEYRLHMAEVAPDALDELRRLSVSLAS